MAAPESDVDAMIRWARASADGVAYLGAIQFKTTLGAGQIAFSPAVPKDNTQIFDVVFQVAWARKTL